MVAKRIVKISFYHLVRIFYNNFKKSRSANGTNKEW